MPWDKSPRMQQCEADDGEQRGERRPDPREATRRQRSALTYGRDRRYAGRAQRREDARDEGDDDPECERDDDRPRLEEQAAVREREADHVEQPEEPLREREPEEEPDHRGDDAHRQRLDHHRATHLGSGGAERAQRGELTRPLRDRDRERVDDHESADEERHHAEREQEVLQERDELVGALGVLACLRVTGANLGAGGQDLPDLRDELLGCDARFGGRADLVELALLVEQPLRGREVEAGEGRPSDRADGAELDETRDAKRLDGAFDLHADRLADPEVLLARPSTGRSRALPAPASCPRRASGS